SPATMRIPRTPAPSAAKDSSSFGIMPPETPPSAMARRPSASVSDGMRLAGSDTSRRTPSVDVTSTRRSAPVATATRLETTSAAMSASRGESMVSPPSLTTSRTLRPGARVLERQPLVEAQHEVHRLDGLPGAALDEVVGHREAGHGAAAVGVGRLAPGEAD